MKDKLKILLRLLTLSAARSRIKNAAILQEAILLVPNKAKALVGKCARHNCKEGYKCALKGDGFTCEIAYCTGRPIVANAELNEPFGLSRDLGHGMMYMCMKGMQMRGKPFAVCRQTGIWKSMFICGKADCKRRGSFLVKIDDESENQWLQSVMLDNNMDNIWIGANDIDQEGTWRWIYDKTTVEFTNWSKEEPNNYNGNENCADMAKRRSYKWNDRSCTSLLRYICER
ncbi:unnamed protein product [Mytilus edulis]|uniref:C-type lectin domain-containing protein n=1 Tax=Mytilus edulis TaxID=6550 RepID=A0A8S3PVY5_MYTED|nr:unnamed protein product [Mytilus edulis]